MKKQIFPALLALAFFAVLMTQPASAGTKEQLIQLQTTVQILQDNMAKMQQSFDERMGVMKDLITQQTDNVNKMTTTIQNLQKTLQQQSNDSGGKVDQVQGQIQSLHDTVDELKARLVKVGKQLDDIQSAQQTINATAAQTQPPGGGSAQNQAPPPDQLYSSGLSDFNAGKNDLASQEFAQFIQVYGTNDLAGNAQFYLGEIDYRKGNYQAAVQDYNKVLDQYPGGNKAAAAQLKKGFALLELNQREAGVKELRSLMARFPKSPEAVQARERLNRLGAAGAAPHGKQPRPSPSHR
ncbi:MAG: tetratricopeptide repeat protein [Acidobacteriia bacterium]|nr:tetratricopeptide repeat protein [Terriglobia bacterium]